MSESSAADIEHGPKSRANGLKPTQEPQQRPRVRKFWKAFIARGMVVAIVLGMGGGAWFVYGSARHDVTGLENRIVLHLENGQADLEAAKTALKQANSTHDQSLVARAKVDFVNARLEFLTAKEVADSDGLLSRLEQLPSLGSMVRSRHRAVDSVSQMGIQIALAGLDLADLDGQLVAPATGGQSGHSLLAMLALVKSKVGAVRIELQQALSAAGQVDGSVLPTSQRATLAHVRSSIAIALETIVQFQALVPILNDVLGGNGIRNYLIEQVNPAELRPGGGFIGTYSVIRVNRGTLQLVASGNAEQLILPRSTVGQGGYVAPPPPFEELIPGVGWSFIDSNFFADFPSNARAGEMFAGPHLKIHLDAVIAIDYYTVAGLLALTGPIAVPGYRLTLGADNFVATVAQYDIDSFTDPNADAIHKAILGAIAGPLFDKLVTLSPSRWPSLLSSLNSLAASRHLQAYFDSSSLETMMVQYGWSGVLNSSASDYMMEVEANLGGTKSNYFVTRAYVAELTRNGATLHHKISVDITDNMPYEYRPHEYYHAYIRMFVNGKATARRSDLSYPHYNSPAPPPGTKMIDGWVEFHGYGHDRVVTFQWDTPWQANGRGVEQVYWQKQPGTINDAVTVIWHDGNGHTYKVSGDLGQDRVITLAPTGVSLAQGQVGTAQLPSLSLG